MPTREFLLGILLSIGELKKDEMLKMKGHIRTASETVQKTTNLFSAKWSKIADSNSKFWNSLWLLASQHKGRQSQ